MRVPGAHDADARKTIAELDKSQALAQLSTRLTEKGVSVKDMDTMFSRFSKACSDVKPETPPTLRFNMSSLDTDFFYASTNPAMRLRLRLVEPRLKTAFLTPQQSESGVGKDWRAG